MSSGKLSMIIKTSWGRHSFRCMSIIFRRHTKNATRVEKYMLTRTCVCVCLCWVTWGGGGCKRRFHRSATTAVLSITGINSVPRKQWEQSPVKDIRKHIYHITLRWRCLDRDFAPPSLRVLCVADRINLPRFGIVNNNNDFLRRAGRNVLPNACTPQTPELMIFPAFVPTGKNYYKRWAPVLTGKRGFRVHGKGRHSICLYLQAPPGYT